MNTTTTVRASEQMLAGAAGTITLKTWQPSSQSAEPIFLLPNGYGVLPYAESVCEELAVRGRKVYSLDLRGQGGNPGEYSVPGAAEDIAEAVARVAEQESFVHLLAHCSAALPLILLGNDVTTWRSVKSVLLYHYLAEPQAHLDRFRMKCARYGVQVAEDIGRLDCYGPEAYRDIPVPFAVVHPNIPANLLRADTQQIRELAEKAGIAVITTPESGYDINTNPQKTLVRKAIDRDLLPLVG
jgi:hypothetical protein